MKSWCIAALLLTAGVVGSFRGSDALATFSKTSNATLLVYFNNGNDFGLLANGQSVPLHLETHLWTPGSCCAHRATPALSHDGTRIAFVRLVAPSPRREAVTIVDVRSGEMKEVFTAQAVWGVSWSFDDHWLAVIADGEISRQHALQVIELSSGAVAQLIRGGMELDGLKYNLSDYAPASWNRDGTRLAVEFRRAGPGANNGTAGAIMVWDFTTRHFRKLTDGVDPSWSPAGDSIAFFDGARKKCFSITSEGGDVKLLFSSSKGPLPAGTVPLVFPVAWSPDGSNLIFHEWVDADLVVDVYRYDVGTRKAKHLGRSELQVVNWR